MKKAIKALAGLVILALMLAGAATAEGTCVYVRATGRVNVRSGPGESYSSINTMQKDEQVVYLGQTDADNEGGLWYKVQYYSYGTYWVSSAYAELVAGGYGEEGVASTSNATSGSQVVATGGKSNLRSGPGLAYDTLGTFPEGASATYLNNNSVDERGVRWYNVNYNGTNAWVSSRYTTLQSGSGGGSTPSGYELYVRATGRVNVRSGPAESYSSINTMQKGEQVRYLGTARYDAGGTLWYKVRYYSFGEYWVCASYAEIVADAANAEGVPGGVTLPVGSYVKATGGKSSIRKGPTLDDGILKTLQKDEIASYLNKSSVDERGVTWYYINYDGTVGWVSSRYTTLY